MKSTVHYQGHEVVELNAGDSRALFAPRCGARLLTWEIAGAPIVFWPDDADWSNVAHVRGGNPILFPFVARHMVDGVIGKWRDSDGTVRDLPMHGFARDMAFEVVEDNDPDSLRMRLRDTPETRVMFPFEFIFEVIYRLEGNALSVEFETTNRGLEPMPYYPGHHFYFAIAHGQRAAWHLHLPCRRWGWQNPDGSARFEPATTQVEMLDDKSLIDRFNLDFSSGTIVLENPAVRRIEIELTSGSGLVPWYDVTTWTAAPESDFFCVEPWLGLPNAIHHALGLRHLGAGETERAACRIFVD